MPLEAKTQQTDLAESRAKAQPPKRYDRPPPKSPAAPPALPTTKGSASPKPSALLSIPEDCAAPGIHPPCTPGLANPQKPRPADMQHTQPASGAEV